MPEMISIFSSQGVFYLTKKKREREGGWLHVSKRNAFMLWTAPLSEGRCPQKGKRGNSTINLGKKRGGRTWSEREVADVYHSALRRRKGALSKRGKKVFRAALLRVKDTVRHIRFKDPGRMEKVPAGKNISRRSKESPDHHIRLAAYRFSLGKVGGHRKMGFLKRLKRKVSKDRGSNRGHSCFWGAY